MLEQSSNRQAVYWTQMHKAYFSLQSCRMFPIREAPLLPQDLDKGVFKTDGRVSLNQQRIDTWLAWDRERKVLGTERNLAFIY